MEENKQKISPWAYVALGLIILTISWALFKNRSRA